MDYPLKIVIKSTGEELQFLEYSNRLKIYAYAYTKSITKNGLKLNMTEEVLKKLIKTNL